jgi:hypothetical protein
MRNDEVPYARDSQGRLSHDDVGLEMQHAKPQSLEPSIAPSISTEPPSMIRTVNFDDEAAGGSEEVDDVLAEHDLPSKRDPELTAGKPSPEAGFRESGLSAHDASALVE